jgi:ribosomal protein L13E
MHHVKPEVFKADGRRSGKGFSLEELKQAGLNRAEAKRLEIPVDRRRRTVHERNVEVVKAFVEKMKAAEKPKLRPRVKSEKKAKK